MAVTKDIIQNNLKKQLALNSGQLSVVNQGGSWVFADQSGQPISGTTDAANYALSQSPARYVSTSPAQSYNLAKGMFGGTNVPDDLVTALANMATYYSSQTGVQVTDLFKNGVMLNEFLATVNSIRTPGSQIGYVGINPTPSWSKNATLGPTIAAVLNGN
jgi:hypothetical protein